MVSIFIVIHRGNINLHKICRNIYRVDLLSAATLRNFQVWEVITNQYWGKQKLIFVSFARFISFFIHKFILKSGNLRFKLFYLHLLILFHYSW